MNGKVSFNAGISELLADVLEASYKALKKKRIGVVSTEEYLGRMCKAKLKISAKENQFIV